MSERIVTQPEAAVPIPFEIQARFLTKRELERMMAWQLEKGGYLENQGVPEERNGHYKRYDVMAAELGRREQLRRDREAKRQKKMIDAALKWHAEQAKNGGQA